MKKSNKMIVKIRKIIPLLILTLLMVFAINSSLIARELNKNISSKKRK